MTPMHFANGVLSSFLRIVGFPSLADTLGEEHTLLVTETGVEILTARKVESPGGPIPPKEEVKAADGPETG